MAKKAVAKKAAPASKEKSKKPVAKASAKASPAAKAPPAKAAKSTPTALKKAPEVKKQEVKKVAAPVKPVQVKQVSEITEKIKIDRDSMTEEQIKWAEMYNKFKDTQAMTYDMKASFKAGAPIQHKILGWGWIVSNENDRLEVLFKDGKRTLISNYRG